jgi:hypothetical protein
MDNVPILFGVLMAMVLIWFAMIFSLFRMLKNSHPEKYKEMGEPSLFWNNSMKTAWATIKFLFRREHKVLNNSTLSFLSDSMIVFFALYFVLFFGLFMSVISMGAAGVAP